MKKTLSINIALIVSLFVIPCIELKAENSLYSQLATTEKSTPSKNKKNIISKPALYKNNRKINAQLRYSMSERTGTQLSVDGFSLLPIFVAGNIESQDIVRTSHRVSLDINRPLTPNSQISINIPYHQESEKLTNDEGQTKTQTRRKNNGLGDIRMTYSGQLFKNNHKLPLLIGAVTWKAPTGKDAYADTSKLSLGTGFHGIRTGIKTVKQDDPVFLFANFGYTWNIKDKKKAIGTINPSDTYDLSLGATYALTDNFRMHFSLEQLWTTKKTINTIDVINSDQHIASLSIGGSLKISSKKFITLQTSIGLNEATPGFQMHVAIPLKN